MKKILFYILTFILMFGIVGCENDNDDKHEHEFIDGVCSCGEKDPHTHNYVNGVCSCGEKDPHTHNYVNGVCSCGEKDPNYVPVIKDHERINNALNQDYNNVTLNYTLTLSSKAEGEEEKGYINLKIEKNNNEKIFDISVSDDTEVLDTFKLYVVNKNDTEHLYMFDGTKWEYSGTTDELITTVTLLDLADFLLFNVNEGDFTKENNIYKGNIDKIKNTTYAFTDKTSDLISMYLSAPVLPLKQLKDFSLTFENDKVSKIVYNMGIYLGNSFEDLRLNCTLDISKIGTTTVNTPNSLPTNSIE